MEMPQNSYDVIVIGAGPVGQNVADRSPRRRAERRGRGARTGRRRMLILGVRSQQGAVAAGHRGVRRPSRRRRPRGGHRFASIPLAVFGRRDRYVSDWDDSGQVNAYVTGIGADLVRGHGRLDGPRRVAVTTPDGGVATLTARQSVAICVGSGAALPDIPGIAEANPWTNRKGTDSSEVPDRLAVVGGGGVAVEMATAWQGLGSSVTLLARRSGLLPRMEPFAGELVGRGLDRGRCGCPHWRLGDQTAPRRRHRTGDAGT